jgi:hypothetical protein
MLIFQGFETDRLVETNSVGCGTDPDVRNVILCALSDRLIHQSATNPRSVKRRVNEQTAQVPELLDEHDADNGLVDDTF